MDLNAIQAALRDRNIDAWFFYDHHHRDAISYRVLGLPDNLFVTRRWYYVIPANGTPQKLVHRIEAGQLDTLPGDKHEYSSWQELFANIEAMLKPHKRVAMQYSPNNVIFYVSLTDAGTVEFVRGLGKEIVSSGDLVAKFEATLTDDQIKTHFVAKDKIDAIVAAAFKEIGRRVRNGGTNEFEMQSWFLEQFKREGIVTEDPPIVAVNANSGNPHYGPDASHSAPIKEGDWVLLDVWGKLDQPKSVYYDITWTGYVGKNASDRHHEIFKIVTAARDAGAKKVIDTIGSGKNLAGWEVDDATREVINKGGYGKYFVHRTGHSISSEVHGNGANMDNLEIHDERQVLPNSCFSIEPGIYLPEFGVRSEVNMMVREHSAEVTGKIQKEIVLI